MRRKLIPIAGVLLVLVLAAASSDGENSTQSTKSESNTRDASYKALVANNPAHRMAYSPTRKTANFWVDTWNVPGQLAFVYMKDSGKITGYYVMEGPPVSMCAALTPTWQYEGTPQDDSDDLNQRVPAPSVDGVYYSGGQCNSYYGIDASTHAYLEFSIGGTQNYVLTTQPLPSTGSLPAEGFTDVSDVHKSGDKYVVNG